ncbi:hypothetical protein ACIQU5_27875 [Streptomyces sp. NPDC090306]|uniref:hypothetical protein n=1 Tax=Streptomyces sp. NPDC090306 TaxID=3365961 RepID=UPI0038164D24
MTAWLGDLGTVLAACCPIGVILGRLRAHQAWGTLALAWLLSWLQDVADGRRAVSYVDAALVAWCAWRWWKGGGGDNTRLRLRRLARRFTPVRRTAPTDGTRV